QEDHLNGLPGAYGFTAQGPADRLVVGRSAPLVLIPCLDGLGDPPRRRSPGGDVEPPEHVDEGLTRLRHLGGLGQARRHGHSLRASANPTESTLCPASANL